jgi:hypothetical protein
MMTSQIVWADSAILPLSVVDTGADPDLKGESSGIFFKRGGGGNHLLRAILPKKGEALGLPLGHTFGPLTINIEISEF